MLDPFILFPFQASLRFRFPGLDPFPLLDLLPEDRLLPGPFLILVVSDLGAPADRPPFVSGIPASVIRWTSVQRRLQCAINGVNDGMMHRRWVARGTSVNRRMIYTQLMSARTAGLQTEVLAWI